MTVAELIEMTLSLIDLIILGVGAAHWAIFIVSVIVSVIYLVRG